MSECRIENIKFKAGDLENKLLNMEFTHIDGDEQILSETLLEKGINIEIVKNHTKVEKKFSPFFRQVECDLNRISCHGSVFMPIIMRIYILFS